MLFKSYQKFCKECGIQLKLNNNRDIDRKNFCNHSCRAKFASKTFDMNIMWAKAHTPEANIKKTRSGKLNGRWLDDRAAIKHRGRYENYEWKRLVMERDLFTCKDCGQVGKELHVHHKAPYKLFPKLRWAMDNGITFCKPCHKKLHSAFTKVFGAITSQKGAQYAVC